MYITGTEILLEIEKITQISNAMLTASMADPGFPVWGHRPIGGEGGADLRRGWFSVKMYVKTKELGDVRQERPLDPPMSFVALLGLKYYQMKT